MKKITNEGERKEKNKIKMDEEEEAEGIVPEKWKMQMLQKNQKKFLKCGGKKRRQKKRIRAEFPGLISS